MSGHWFDRLAAPQTRRGGFKLAISGALATVPLVKSASAGAAPPNCVKPCVYVSQAEASSEFENCSATFASGYFHSLSLWFTPVAPSSIPLATKDVINKIRCDEKVRIKRKAASYDCVKTGDCGGFDAQANKDVLCPGCQEVGGRCCPAPSVGTLSGYVCCGCCAETGDGCGAGPC